MENLTLVCEKRLREIVEENKRLRAECTRLRYGLTVMVDVFDAHTRSEPGPDMHAEVAAVEAGRYALKGGD